MPYGELVFTVAETVVAEHANCKTGMIDAKYPNQSHSAHLNYQLIFFQLVSLLTSELMWNVFDFPVFFLRQFDKAGSGLRVNIFYSTIKFRKS